MDSIIQALVMGIVQGLTEFLPVSSSGHLIIVPWLFGWDDAFINSLAFSVMLHLGTLIALLLYFRDDWFRLIPAGFATIRDRSLKDDPDRKLAWLLVAATIPAAIVGALFSDFFETQVREIGLVALTLVVGGVILWVADHVGRQTKTVDDVTFPLAIGIGAAQTIALIPGISRSGISISAGRFAGLDRESAARFAFLMATPITAGAIVFEARKLLTGEAGVAVEVVPLIVGLVASLVSGVIAIRFMLGYLRTRSLDVFVFYRFILAAVVLIVWLAR
ncbi:MAG TPA: undecaprenyl-diphosphatase UppP [Candidatus Limnocylindrales bacterium]|nr:undecaprenyl-diphosphatase UppP [Candidatus Limnocylindrales bacterium]